MRGRPQGPHAVSGVDLLAAGRWSGGEAARREDGTAPGQERPESGAAVGRKERTDRYNITDGNE